MRFNYVDIGTSDFDTSLDRMSHGETGLFVEPLFEYLARLPDSPGIIKAPFAISDYVGYGTMYFVDKEAMASHQLPAYTKGCNSLNRPHQWLTPQLAADIPVSQVQVPVITFHQLLDIYSIDAIDHLKIDTEGHDHIILKQVAGCVDRLKISTMQIEYVESNDNVSDLDELLGALQQVGFSLERRGIDAVLTRMR